MAAEDEVSPRDVEGVVAELARVRELLHPLEEVAAAELERPKAAADALEQALTRYSVRDDCFLGDMAIRGFVRHILAHGHAVISLLEGQHSRGAFAVARSAFEGLQDLLLLVTEPDLDVAGARAICSDLFDKAALYREGQSEVTELDGKLMIYTSLRPRYRRMLQTELKRVREARTRRIYHWSGCRGRGAVNRILMDRLPGLWSEGGHGGLYAILSYWTHPTARIGVDEEGGYIAVLALEPAWMAMGTAEKILTAGGQLTDEMRKRAT